MAIYDGEVTGSVGDGMYAVPLHSLCEWRTAGLGSFVLGRNLLPPQALDSHGTVVSQLSQALFVGVRLLRGKVGGLLPVTNCGTGTTGQRQSCRLPPCGLRGKRIADAARGTEN